MSNSSGTNPVVSGVEQYGSNAGISALRIAKAIYNFATDGGAIATITPANNASLPNNAVVVAATINSTTAVTSAGSATVSIGTIGGTTTSILAATAKASLSANAVLNGVPVFATPVKLTTGGSISFTVGTAVLTAGVIECVLYYYIAAN